MTDIRALGTVGSTIQTLLIDRIETTSGAPAPDITVSSPADVSEAAVPHAQVIAFLYRVVANAVQSPSSGGAQPSRLDRYTLHFLLTSLGGPSGRPGERDEVAAHALLGASMHVLEQTPIITDAVVTQRSPAGKPVLHQALRGGTLQIVASSPSAEDLTALWSALGVPYRLSALYEARFTPGAARQSEPITRYGS